MIDNDDERKELDHLIGRVITAILISVLLEPRKFDCARRFQKAMGLNLKEKSSGRYAGRLTLTKRGRSIARKYLYFAARRLLRTEPIVKQGYQNKHDPTVKIKTVMALMRKLSKALWQVVRGARFNANKRLRIPKPAA